MRPAVLTLLASCPQEPRQAIPAPHRGPQAPPAALQALRRAGAWLAEAWRRGVAPEAEVTVGWFCTVHNDVHPDGEPCPGILTGTCFSDVCAGDDPADGVIRLIDRHGRCVRCQSSALVSRRLAR